MRGPALTAAGGAESGVVSRVDNDGRPQDTGVGPPDEVGSVNAGVALGAEGINATEEIELAGGGISSGWVTAVVPGRALPPRKKNRETYCMARQERERERKREREREGVRTRKRE